MLFNPLACVSRLLKWIFSTVSVFLNNISRPFVKWLLRKTTGLCELQRICYCEPNGAPRIHGIGNLPLFDELIYVLLISFIPLLRKIFKKF